MATAYYQVSFIGDTNTFAPGPRTKGIKVAFRTYETQNLLEINNKWTGNKYCYSS